MPGNGSDHCPEDKQQIDNAVRQLYMRDFIVNWDRFLADIQLNNSADLSQRINTARLLSGTNSPLRRLVLNLSKVLTLSRTAPAPEDAQKRKTKATAPPARWKRCSATVTMPRRRARL